MFSGYFISISFWEDNQNIISLVHQDSFILLRVNYMGGILCHFLHMHNILVQYVMVNYARHHD